MSAVLRSIIWVQAHEYELTFDVGGATLTCTCTVLAQDGVRFVQAVPDFLSTLGISPRSVAAAVLAFDLVNVPGT
ncbi:hypothetical protein BE21_11755 [Sorangium cellulosum]|uniref:Uncharacterized protein n=1 Tax=Sorangium cellulosum TaxID=56 RepID=A0A150U0J3_SORCE|nr:hypothetical protein BE21_11755 [Sorangium cellulosum]